MNWLRTSVLSITILGLLYANPSPVVGAETTSFPGLGPAGELVAINFEAGESPILRGQNARRQLVVTGKYATGQLHDLTHAVAYQVDTPAILSVNKEGIVVPLADGEATVTATEPTGKQTAIKLQVERCRESLPLNFANEIVPIFTKLGCNAGGCHGKSDGQNGFKLSLLGFYPDDDYEYLVKEDRGRRIFPADPEFSLLLLKPANKLPHGGGHRLSPGSYEWQLIASWIEQGMPQGSPSDPTIDRIEVFPKSRAMNCSGKQQLRVVAHYTDSSARDVTQIATYESNDTEMAEATASGLVTVHNVPGDVAIMIRFQGEVTVFQSIVPLGLPADHLSPPRTFVDELVYQKLKSLGIPPSPSCDDSTFLRRVTLDLTGRLPTVDEARGFLADTDSIKRDKLIERLLDSPAYADYFANKWSALLRNKRRNANDVGATFRFHAWIRQALRDNMSFDQFARNVLAGSGDPESHPPVAWYKEVSTSTQQMEDSAQLFLGLRIQCARCHHHPFEQWSQQDYYGFEAYFSQVGMKPSRYAQQNVNDLVFHKGGVASSRNPRTGLDVKPTPLGGTALEIPAYEDPRLQLVDWMARPDNPFFARALANRYWKHFFGRGIVDPEDDMRVTNPPSNPELLDALARHFVASGFDLKQLVKTICRSSVYQLSSEPNEFNKTDKRNFSSFYPRRLNAEPLYDAVNQLAGVTSSFGGVPAGTRAVQLPDNGFDDYFLTVFGKPEANSACECERSSEANLAQSLHLLNSSDMQGRFSAGNGRAAMLARDQGRTEADKITELYLGAFARPPRSDELERCLSHIAKKTNKQEAYEDILWALCNTKEFLFVR